MTDCQLVITGPFGRIDLTSTDDFTETQAMGTAWGGTFTLARDTKDADDLYGLIEQSWFDQIPDGVPVQMWRPLPDGTEYRYDNARLSLAPGGVAFTASGRVRV